MGLKDIGIRKPEFLKKTQFLWCFTLYLIRRVHLGWGVGIDKEMGGGYFDFSVLGFLSFEFEFSLSSNM